MKNKRKQTINISARLRAIEDELWGLQADFPEEMFGFGEKDIRAGAKIFLTVMQDGLWDMKIHGKERSRLGRQLGIAIRELIKKYTELDSRDFY